MRSARGLAGGCSASRPGICSGSSATPGSSSAARGAWAGAGGVPRGRTPRWAGAGRARGRRAAAGGLAACGDRRAPRQRAGVAARSATRAHGCKPRRSRRPGCAHCGLERRRARTCTRTAARFGRSGRGACGTSPAPGGCGRRAGVPTSSRVIRAHGWHARTRARVGCDARSTRSARQARWMVASAGWCARCSPPTASAASGRATRDGSGNGSRWSCSSRMSTSERPGGTGWCAAAVADRGHAACGRARSCSSAGGSSGTRSSPPARSPSSRAAETDRSAGAKYPRLDLVSDEQTRREERSPETRSDRWRPGLPFYGRAGPPRSNRPASTQGVGRAQQRRAKKKETLAMGSQSGGAPNGTGATGNVFVEGDPPVPATRASGRPRRGSGRVVPVTTPPPATAAMSERAGADGGPAARFTRPPSGMRGRLSRADRRAARLLGSLAARRYGPLLAVTAVGVLLLLSGLALVSSASGNTPVLERRLAVSATSLTRARTLRGRAAVVTHRPVAAVASSSLPAEHPLAIRRNGSRAVSFAKHPLAIRRNGSRAARRPRTLGIRARPVRLSSATTSTDRRAPAAPAAALPAPVAPPVTPAPAPAPAPVSPVSQAVPASAAPTPRPPAPPVSAAPSCYPGMLGC